MRLALGSVLVGRATVHGWLALAALAVAFLLSPPARALDVPALTGRVVDGAAVLSPEARTHIDGLLAAYEKQSGQQFALLTVPTLGGDALEDFSIRVVDKWQLGKKGKDDGLLLLVVTQDRRVRIEVGRGLEGDVTDAISSRIIRNVIGPAFRKGDYEGGIERALDALMRTASGQAPNVPEDEPRAAPTGSSPGIGVWILLALFIVPVLLASRRGGRYGGGGGMFFGGGGFGGGGFGGGGGGFGGGGGGFGGGGSSGRW